MTVKKLIPNFLCNQFTYKIEKIQIYASNFINAIESKFCFIKLKAPDFDYVDQKNFFYRTEEIEYKKIIELGLIPVFVRSTDWNELKKIQNETM